MVEFVGKASAVVGQPNVNRSVQQLLRKEGRPLLRSCYLSTDSVSNRGQWYQTDGTLTTSLSLISFIVGAACKLQWLLAIPFWVTFKKQKDAEEILSNRIYGHRRRPHWLQCLVGRKGWVVHCARKQHSQTISGRYWRTRSPQNPSIAICQDRLDLNGGSTVTGLLFEAVF